VREAGRNLDFFDDERFQQFERRTRLGLVGH